MTTPAPDLEALSYPVGDFRADAVTTTRAHQIETLRLLPERLREAVHGLADAQLDTPYRPDGWTVRQVVHHVADSHAAMFGRIKLALTEDNPTIKPYDQAAWAELPDSRLPVEPSLAILDGVHARVVALLNALQDSDFDRTFFHPEHKKSLPLHTVLAMYEWHSLHHTAHITGLRKRMGW